MQDGVQKSPNHSQTKQLWTCQNQNMFGIWDLTVEWDTVGVQLSDMSGNWMAISSPVTEWFVIQVTIQLPD